MKKNISKIISVTLCIMLLASMCITASAASLSGKGTKNNPYTIKTAAELEAFASDVAKGESFNGKFIRLEADIKVTSSFKAIGSKDKPFKGTFDGNGKTLSGFNMNCDYAAPFGYTVGAVISDLSVTGKFTATSYAAGIVAYGTDTTIEKCVSTTYTTADKYSGGIAGYINGGKITGCSTTLSSSIYSKAEFCGGIAGWSSAEINSCENNAYTSGLKNVGGIAGVSEGSIISCTNTVLVEATRANVGGIAGLAKGEIRYSKNTGEISSSGSSAGKTGGIAGNAIDATITECHNDGEISAAGSFTGGIAAYATNGSITNCLVTAAVSSSGENAGGIFGCAIGTAVSSCVVTSSVSAKNSTDAAIGAVSSAAISDCYYNSSLESAAVRTNSSSVKNTKGISSSSFTTAAALSALDFSKIWVINTVHASYPLLKAIPYHTLKITSSYEADCTNDGKVTGVCSLCTETVVTVTPAYGHTLNVVSYEAPTCTKDGFRDSLCTTCTKTISEDIPATGHKDADQNLFCDVCDEDISEKQPEKAKNIFEKIADFFNSILEWIRNLFTKK